MKAGIKIIPAKIPPDKAPINSTIRNRGCLIKYKGKIGSPFSLRCSADSYIINTMNNTIPAPIKPDTLSCLKLAQKLTSMLVKPYIIDKTANDKIMVPIKSKRPGLGSDDSFSLINARINKTIAIGTLIKNKICQFPVKSSKNEPMFGPNTAATPFIAPKSPKYFACLLGSTVLKIWEFPMIKIPPPPSA
ncbi:hypothetical protein D3C81_1645270 [compost metagenome]